MRESQKSSGQETPSGYKILSTCYCPTAPVRLIQWHACYLNPNICYQTLTLKWVTSLIANVLPGEQTDYIQCISLHVLFTIHFLHWFTKIITVIQSYCFRLHCCMQCETLVQKFATGKWKPLQFCVCKHWFGHLLHVIIEAKGHLCSSSFQGDREAYKCSPARKSFHHSSLREVKTTDSSWRSGTK